MKNRLPLALALALAAAACTPPGGGTGPAAGYDGKVAKVEQLTRALSLSQNEELKQAASSLQTLGGSMTQGGFANATAAAGGLVAAGGGNLVAAGGGNLVAAGGGNIVGNAGGNATVNTPGNYLLQALVTDLNAATRKDVYQLLGDVQANGSTLSYDDETGELTGIADANMEASFAFVNSGAKRTWTIDIKKSPDGTTGKLTIEVTADVWRDASTAPGFQQPSAEPPPSDDAWWGTDEPQAEAPMPGAPQGEEPYDYGTYGLSQAQPQLKIFNNEVPDPDTLTAFRFACDLTPQGDPKLRVKLDALIDEVQVTKLGRMPTHLGLNVTVPTVQFTSDTRMDGDTKFASKGGLKVRTAEAIESLKYDLDLVVGANTGKLDLVHEGAKVRLGVVASKGPKPGQPEVVTALYDTETNQKIGDLEPAKGEPNVVMIKFTNGKTVRWDIAGGTTAVLPTSTGTTGGRPGGLAGGTSPQQPEAPPVQAPTARPSVAPTPFRF